MNSKLGAPSCTSRAAVVGKCCFARFGRSNLRFLARVRTQTGGHPAYGVIAVADENLKQSEQATWFGRATSCANRPLVDHRLCHHRVIDSLPRRSIRASCDSATYFRAALLFRSVARPKIKIVF